MPRTKKESVAEEKDGLARISDAMDFLSLSRGMIYNLIARGELTAVSIGDRARRVTRSSMRAYFNKLIAKEAV